MSSSAAIAKILNNQTKDKGTNELKRKLNIESNMASSLKSAAISLKKEQTKDAVNKGLRKRSSLEYLQNTGIIKKAGPTQFQAQSEALKKAQTVDSLRKQWEARSSIDKLKEKGIVKDAPNSFQARSQSLEKARKIDALKHKFERRSSLESLQKQQIFKTQQSIQKEQERKQSAEQIIDQHIQNVVQSKNM